MGESLVQAYRSGGNDVSNSQAWHYAEDLFAELHLPSRLLLAPPRQLSGGERKRSAIARCLAVFGYPHQTNSTGTDRLMIIDEPTVGIDVFLQAVVAAVLIAAQERLGLTYLIISHDEEFVTRLRFYRATAFLRLALVYVIRPRWHGLAPRLVHLGSLDADPVGGRS